MLKALMLKSTGNAEGEKSEEEIHVQIHEASEGGIDKSILVSDMPGFDLHLDLTQKEKERTIENNETGLGCENDAEGLGSEEAEGLGSEEAEGLGSEEAEGGIGSEMAEGLGIEDKKELRSEDANPICAQKENSAIYEDDMILTLAQASINTQELEMHVDSAIHNVIKDLKQTKEDEAMTVDAGDSKETTTPEQDEEQNIEGDSESHKCDERNKEKGQQENMDAHNSKDKHIAVAFYYLALKRKQYQIKQKYATTDPLFIGVMKLKCEMVTNDKTTMTEAASNRNIMNTMLGSNGLPWEEADFVYMPLNIGMHWILLV
ncbi:unnamed protein product, partial [Cuscuta europaea]